MAAQALIGPGEFAIRLPSALAGTLAVLATAAGLRAGLVLATALFLFIEAKVLTADATLLLATTLSFWAWGRLRACPADPRPWRLLFWVGVGAGLLAKVVNVAFLAAGTRWAGALGPIDLGGVALVFLVRSRSGSCRPSWRAAGRSSPRDWATTSSPERRARSRATGGRPATTWWRSSSRSSRGRRACRAPSPTSGGASGRTRPSPASSRGSGPGASSRTGPSRPRREESRRRSSRCQASPSASGPRSWRARWERGRSGRRSPRSASTPPSTPSWPRGPPGSTSSSPWSPCRPSRRSGSRARSPRRSPATGAPGRGSSSTSSPTRASGTTSATGPGSPVTRPR